MTSSKPGSSNELTLGLDSNRQRLGAIIREPVESIRFAILDVIFPLQGE